MLLRGLREVHGILGGVLLTGQMLASFWPFLLMISAHVLWRDSPHPAMIVHVADIALFSLILLHPCGRILFEAQRAE
jgi:hypothetical protein